MSNLERLSWDILGMGLAAAALWTISRHLHPISEILLLAAFVPLGITHSKKLK